MHHAPAHVLDHAGTAVIQVDGAYAPWGVIEVLPVEEAVLPIPSPIVPPLTGGVLVTFGIAIQRRGMAVLSRGPVDAPGSEAVAQDAPRRDAAYDDYGIVIRQAIGIQGIGIGHGAARGEVDAYPSPAGLAGGEAAAVPPQLPAEGLVALLAPGDALPGREVGPVVHRIGRDEDVYRRPKDALRQGEDPVAEDVLREAEREHQEPAPCVPGTLGLPGGTYNL